MTCPVAVAILYSAMAVNVWCQARDDELKPGERALVSLLWFPALALDPWIERRWYRRQQEMCAKLEASLNELQALKRLAEVDHG